MSLSTWKGEFYAVTAAVRGKVGTERAAVIHCIKKWKGLRKANVEKHGGKIQARDLFGLNFNYLYFEGDRGVFEVSGSNCALCVRHMTPMDDPNSPWNDGPNCSQCVLMTVGGAPCWDGTKKVPAPFTIFHTSGDPEPMISLLEKAKKYLATKKA